MAFKINFPKKNSYKHKQKLIVIQGTCDNSAKVDGVLTDSGGNTIAGQKLTSAKPTHWGYRYRLDRGTYKFSVTQTNSPVLSDDVTFNVDPIPLPPPPGTPPTIGGPGDSENVASVFTTFGTSNAGQTISSISFTGNGQNVPGMVTQQTDVNGEWVGSVDISACPSGSGYVLTVTNGTGPSSVNNLRIP